MHWRWALLVIALFLDHVCALDIYIVRHGARSSTKFDLPEIFGVSAGQLTDGGKSQAYYYGQELRLRHRDIANMQFRVYASKYDRTVQTARFFLQGWYKSKTTDNGTYFKSNPKYLPPCKLSFKPKADRFIISNESYSSKLIVARDDLVRGARCLPKDEGHPSNSLQDHDIWKRMINSSACEKFNAFRKGLCSGEKSYKQITKDFLNMENLYRCMDFMGLHIPHLNYDEINLLSRVKNNYNLRKFGDESRMAASVTTTFNFIDDMIEDTSLELVVLFTHDTHQIPLMKALLGNKQYLEEFQHQTRVPFLNSVRINIEDGLLRLFMNDREFKLHQCKQSHTTCEVDKMMQLIEKYRKPLNEICPDSSSD